MEARTPEDDWSEIVATLEVDQAPELTETAAAYDEFAAKNTAFLEACSEFASEPDETRRETVIAHGTELVNALRCSVNTVQKTFGTSAAVPIIFSMLIAEDATYVDHLVQLTNEPGLGKLKPDKFYEALEEFAKEAENEEAFTECVVASFARNLTSDLNLFANKAFNDYQQERRNMFIITFGHAIVAEAASEDDEAGKWYPFSIQPPINPHNPEFMGQDISLNFSDSTATYGHIWVADALTADKDADEAETVVQEHMAETFSDSLNPLGTTRLRLLWPEREASPSENPEL